MATTEIERFSPEQQQAYRQIAGFFGRAESEFPAAAGQLVNVVGGLVGEQRVNRQELQAGMGNIDVGLALIGDWLKETGAEGFDVNLGFGGGAKKAIGRSKVKFPTASDLIRIRGRVDPELKAQIPPLLSSFSRQIKGGLDVGLSPRQIVGGLVAESVGSRLSADGSANLREALIKPLAGHFEWIRDALKISDVAGQTGFKPVPPPETKQAVAPKQLPEISRAEAEFIREKNRIKEYLTQEGGMDFLARTWDEDKWEHVGDDGSVKRVYRPLRGILAEEKVCLRENVSDQVISYRESAPLFRPETQFLQRVNGPHFVKVYARAPLDQTDSQGVGNYRTDRHWELVDFVDGILVNRVVDRERGMVVWPEALTPATRLRVLLAACECENEATHLSPPAYLTDLKTDAFIVSSDGEQIKQVDCQVHDKYVDAAHSTIAIELVRLCLELFPGSREFVFVDIEKAIGWYLDPQRYENDKRFFYGGQSHPILTDILESSRSALPAGVESGLLRFLDEIKEGKLPVGRIPMRLAERILPIAQRLEREESAARAERGAVAARKEAQTKEADLTLAEKAFMGALENLKTIENMSGSINADAREMQQYFQDMRSYFSRLPSDGQLRMEVMKNVNNQLGAEGERLKKAGKPEAEIFEEWLKQVFIPLYRRAGKPK